MRVDFDSVLNALSRGGEIADPLKKRIEKIAELENFEVSDEHLEKEYAPMAEQYKMDLDKVKAAIPAEAVKNDLRIEKALDLVRDSAKVEEVTE